MVMMRIISRRGKAPLHRQLLQNKFLLELKVVFPPLLHHLNSTIFLSLTSILSRNLYIIGTVWGRIQQSQQSKIQGRFNRNFRSNWRFISRPPWKSISISNKYRVSTIAIFVQLPLQHQFFRRREADSFTSRITLDLGTINYYDENRIRDHLFEHIQRYQRLGSHAVAPQEFNFVRFQGMSNTSKSTSLFVFLVLFLFFIYFVST